MTQSGHVQISSISYEKRVGHGTMSKSDRVSSWLTLGANVGVVVGLALLIFELRQNSDLVRAQIHQARSDNYESFMVAIADTEYFLPTYEKFAAAGGPQDISALDVLSSIERERSRRYFQGRIGGYDNLYFQYKQGYLDEEFYESRVVGSVRRLSPLWSELGMLNSVSPSFLSEIERIRSSD